MNIKYIKDKNNIDQPIALPHSLTFQGAVTGSFDGTSDITITIPSGGNSGGSVTTETGMKYYNSVAAMIEDKATLASMPVGTVVHTRGYYAPGDGGDAEYKIDSAPLKWGNYFIDSYMCFPLNGEVSSDKTSFSGTKALNLLPRDGKINILQVGCKGDSNITASSNSYSTTKGSDNTPNMQILLNYVAYSAGKWEILVPNGHFAFYSPLELQEGGKYIIKGVNATKWSHNGTLGYNCSFITYGNHMFTGSNDRRYQETGGSNSFFYGPSTVMIEIRSMMFWNASSNPKADLFHNIVLKNAVISQNAIHNYYIVFAGGFVWVSIIEKNLIVGVKRALIGPTDLPHYTQAQQYVQLVDVYLTNNYVNGDPTSTATNKPRVVDMGSGSSSMTFVTSIGNFYDFFLYFAFSTAYLKTGDSYAVGSDGRTCTEIETALNASGFQNWSSVGDTFDYMVSMFGPRQSVTNVTFNGCKFTHFSRNYGVPQSSGDNYLPVGSATLTVGTESVPYTNQIWAPFRFYINSVQGLSVMNCSCAASDGFFVTNAIKALSSSKYDTTQLSSVSYASFLNNVKFVGNIIFEVLGSHSDNPKNESIGYFFCSALPLSTGSKGFYCDALERKVYTGSLPEILKNNVYNFYEGQEIVHNNRILRCSGTYWYNATGSAVTA